MFEHFHIFTNLDASIEFLRSVPWYWVLVFSFVVTFVENIFPPSPSDSILLFTGSLVSLGNIGFIPLLLAASLGSSVGFMLMYFLGYKFGQKFIDSNRFKFINSDSMKKPEEWFRKYGFWIIIANRFLSGTRAVISVFAGISKLHFAKTTFLSTISAIVWNSILIYLGIVFAKNLHKVIDFISLYGSIIGKLTLIIIIGYILYSYLIKKKKNI